MENVFPKVVFTVFGLPVRNSVISTWVMMAMIVIGVLYVRKKVPVVLEMLIDFTEDLAGSFIRRSTDPFIPFLGSLLVFIAVANLIGIVPMMVTPTRDINTPLALALVVLVAKFMFGIKVKGIGGFFKGLLSVTLPLDVIGGEIVVAVLARLIPVGIPLVMVVLSSITGILQAYVFTVLAASYISSMVDA
jgi:F-type H+-transporting ATPase subunit a